MKQIPTFRQRHLVFLIFKKKPQENDGVGDISSLFHLTMSLEPAPSFSCFFLEYHMQEYKMSIFGIVLFYALYRML